MGQGQFTFSVQDQNGPVTDPFIPRVATLMVSIRNRSFTTKLLNAFCEFAITRCQGGVLTIVDAPYRHNIHAQTPEGPLRDLRIERLAQLSAERTSNAQRCLRKARNDSLRFMSWADYVAKTPPWITAEINAAYSAGGPFAQAVSDHVLRVVDKFQFQGDVGAFAVFFLEELPILIYAQYLFEGGTLDCYAGAQPEILWDIDRGAFQADLPQISAMIEAAPRMLFADIQSTSDAPL